jgi:hypothetical protein
MPMCAASISVKASAFNSSLQAGQQAVKRRGFSAS